MAVNPILAKLQAQKAAAAAAAAGTEVATETSAPAAAVVEEETVVETASTPVAETVVEEETASATPATTSEEPVVETTQEADAVTETTSSDKKEIFTAKKEPKPAASTKKDVFTTPRAQSKKTVEVAAGAVLPRDVLIARFAEKLEASDEYDKEKYAVPTVGTLGLVIKLFEELMVTEILPHHPVNLFGVRFKHSNQDARIYPPNEVLARVKTPYHTMAKPHLTAKLALSFGKELLRGTMVDGQFVEGKFEEDGSFVPGTWAADKETFTPAV